MNFFESSTNDTDTYSSKPFASYTLIKEPILQGGTITKANTPKGILPTYQFNSLCICIGWGNINKKEAWPLVLAVWQNKQNDPFGEIIGFLGHIKIFYSDLATLNPYLPTGDQYVNDEV